MQKIATITDTDGLTSMSWLSRLLNRPRYDTSSPIPVESM